MFQNCFLVKSFRVCFANRTRIFVFKTHKKTETKDIPQNLRKLLSDENRVVSRIHKDKQLGGGHSHQLNWSCYSAL